MRRRDFLKVASGAVGTAVAVDGAAAEGDPSGTAPAQQSGTTTAGNGTTGTQTTGNQTTTTSGGGGGGGGGQTVTVNVSTESNDLVFQPGTSEPLYITPGTTVEFVWKGNLPHNIVVDSQPEGASWSGHETLETAPFTYTHTFETLGTYDYYCRPHRSQGMVGTIVVNETGQPPASEGGGKLSPHEMGVPFQAHFVGIATVLMMIVSTIYTFFVLKYGESRHASGGT
ncbi:MAG: plastocyanin/azurin family copper-binding protein [Halobacteriaceae archaeon]